LVNNFLAQTNSVARTPKPTGITRKAGPGSTINATPIKRIVKPATITMSLFACCNVFSIRSSFIKMIETMMGDEKGIGYFSIERLKAAVVEAQRAANKNRVRDRGS